MLKVKNCENCNIIFSPKYSKAKYCSLDCQAKHRVSKKYEHYLDNQEQYCNSNKALRFIKKHISREQNDCCSVCQMKNIWNEKHLTLVLDHIDGNAANNIRDNLRLVCPNCDSQLDTYKSKNKNSARKNRYLLNYKHGKQS